MLGKCNMLNFFSSKMTNEEEMKMMHYINMIACNWNMRDIKGYRICPPSAYNLGGTPLNEAIIAMMKIVPKFKNETGVQKVNTVFLTDGCGSNLRFKFGYELDTNPSSTTYGTHIEKKFRLDGRVVITDPVTNTVIRSDFLDIGYGYDVSPMLLKLLKKRVPEMNVVGFFIAGSGRSGKVKANVIRDWFRTNGVYPTAEEVSSAMKTLKKENVLSITTTGYDEFYLLPGANSLMVENESLSNDLVGASKAKLKTAFAKNASGKLTSRPLLNKFIAMVA